VLAITLAGPGPVDLPAGLVFQATPHGRTPMPCASTASTTLVQGRLTALQVHDGTRFVDRTPALRDDAAILAFGAAPDSTEADGPALYLGFDEAWPPDIDVTVHFEIANDATDERARLLSEEADRAADCAHERAPCPPAGKRTDCWCGNEEADPPASAQGGSATTVVLPAHHSVRLAWEFLGASGWRRLDASTSEVTDDTRSLTLDGTVRFRLPAPMAPGSIGALTGPFHWIRVRIVTGRYDEAPSLRAVRLNPVFVRQAFPATDRFVIAKGTTPAIPIGAGVRLRPALEFGDSGDITALGASASARAPELLVIDYEAATPTERGSILLPVRRLLDGSGLPEQHALLADAPVANGTIDVRSIEKGDWRTWDGRFDLDASGPSDAHYSLDAAAGEVSFGDGVRGRVPPAGATVVGGWHTTLAGGGNFRGPVTWKLVTGGTESVAQIGGLVNRALLGTDPAVLAGQFETLSAARAKGGRHEETIGQAASRAAGFLWAHEWLLELCDDAAAESLDQLDPDAVRSRAAPVRAVTAVDYERITLDVPGTRIHRARAWPGFDARYPCLEAPGTITVVIVPGLPSGRPVPTPGLLAAVRRYLERRRTLCTRVVVTGPVYRVVTVEAVVRCRRGADARRVRQDVVASLMRFLDPLVGGPAGRGWPFGRDVYRTEVLHVVDDVAGVDHVVSCVLSTDAGIVDCGNICLGPTELAASGQHEIRVVQP
jgi:hypothetical protein